jgi:hypothetical protein
MTLSLLAQQSPKTHGWLRRTLDQRCLARIEDAYQHAAMLGADDESHLNRTEGASYNPRSARLVLLLTQEGARRDEHSLVASIFLPVADQNRAFNNQQDPFHAEIELARIALLSPKEIITALSGEACEAAHDLHLVWLLDTLRHLHMQYNTTTKLKVALDNLQFSCEELPTTRRSRLQVLVEAHIERLRRQL